MLFVGKRRVRDLMDFIDDRAITLIIDVGANVGEFGERLRSAGYRGKIVSFEPGEAGFKQLSQKASADKNWEVHRCALGAGSGTGTLHVSKLSVFNSLLSTNSAGRLHDERTAVDHTEEVAVRTLDEIGIPLSGNVLLKVDTQGYEKQVLEGARQSMAHMAGILLELPVIRTYEGSWEFHDGLKYMADAGFVPAQIQSVGFHGVDNVSAVEFDCLFRPLSEIDAPAAIERN
jgi:FkbM family methyltransferase